MKFQFRNEIAETIFNNKYRHDEAPTWPDLAKVVAQDVCGGLVPRDIQDAIAEAIHNMEFFPGGRYLYYAGRIRHYWNNCFLLKAEEDTKEDWAQKSWEAERCLTTGGGIGIDYSIYRPKGALLRGSGGQASGPISKMEMINEIGRKVMQGGSRRSAIYASLRHSHPDAHAFVHAKDWHKMPVGSTGYSLADIKMQDPNFPAPLDMTNISVNYDTEWLEHYKETGNYGPVFADNAKQAMMTGEPGFSFNFYEKENETLRNACTEVTSEDNADVCNLGSINMAKIESYDRFVEVVQLATIFLLCGTIRAELPFEQVYRVREKNRRLGLGLMGMYEWLLKRGERYEVTPELHKWLAAYRDYSDSTSVAWANALAVSVPVARRAIAPT